MPRSRSTPSPSSAQVARARASKSAASERDETIERRRVAVVCGDSLGESAGRVLELALRIGDPDPARERRQNGGARLLPSLLLEVADRQPLGCTRDRSGVRLLVPGDDPQQRRLADAVRPDEADARLRADGERDLIENDLGAVVLADAGELHSHRRTSETVGERARRARAGTEVGPVSPS